MWMRGSEMMAVCGRQLSVVCWEGHREIGLMWGQCFVVIVVAF